MQILHKLMSFDSCLKFFIENHTWNDIEFPCTLELPVIILISLKVIQRCWVDINKKLELKKSGYAWYTCLHSTRVPVYVYNCQ